MTARDYDIEIRDTAEMYFGAEHHFYPHMASSEAEGDEGVIKLRIKRGEQIGLTAAEAQDIGETLMGAGHGALQDVLRPAPAGAKIRAHATAMSLALQKVRPLGGSELFVRIDGEYFADPEFYGREIERLIRELHEAKIENVRLKRQLGEMA